MSSAKLKLGILLERKKIVLVNLTKLRYYMFVILSKAKNLVPGA
jgi:hypothetical protein